VRYVEIKVEVKPEEALERQFVPNLYSLVDSLGEIKMGDKFILYLEKKADKVPEYDQGLKMNLDEFVSEYVAPAVRRSVWRELDGEGREGRQHSDNAE